MLSSGRSGLAMARWARKTLLWKREDALLKFRFPEDQDPDVAVSTYEGSVVFADKDLSMLLASAKDIGVNISELTLRVLVEKQQGNKNCFVASRPKTKGYLDRNTRESLEALTVDSFKPSVEMTSVCVIDFQNFSGSLNSLFPMVTYGTLDITDIIEILLKRDQSKPLETMIFDCQQRTRNPAWQAQLAALAKKDPKIKLSDRKTKKIKSDGGFIYKTDVDAISIVHIMKILLTRPEVKHLVLFCGDSDYEEVAKAWLGLGEHADLGEDRSLTIISSIRGRNISLEMTELTNNPRCRLLLIEDLFEEIMKTIPRD